jgi:hypothetical protein
MRLTLVLKLHLFKYKASPSTLKFLFTFHLSGGCHCRAVFRDLDLCLTLIAFNSEGFLCATPAATQDLGLYGLIRRTGPHVPQLDSNMWRKGHQIFTLDLGPRC